MYHPQPARVLLHVVEPLVTECGARGLARRYFFVLGFDGAVHVRLRLLHDRAAGAYLRRLVERRAQSLSRERSASPRVRYVPYEPETQRYGGQVGLRIAERHFEHSSRAVLTALKRTQSMDYEAASGLALQMHIGFAAGWGLERSEAQAFFEYVSGLWEGFACGDGDVLPEHEVDRKAWIQARFGEAATRNSEPIDELGRLYAAARRREIDENDSWFLDWVRDCASMGHALRRSSDGARLRVSRATPLPPQSTDCGDRRLWPILASYAHMTNNRLGIMNRDESYLYYLAARSLALRSAVPTGESRR
jgi:thiopeptide-type bacteriocin biosynthesis protein